MKKKQGKYNVIPNYNLHKLIIRKVDDLNQISNQFENYFKKAIKRGIL